MYGAGVDPAGIESFQPISIAIVGGRNEIERGELECDELVVVIERECACGGGQLRKRQPLVEDRDRGECQARRRGCGRRYLRQESVEAAVATEIQRAVPAAVMGVEVEFVGLQTVRLA